MMSLEYVLSTGPPPFMLFLHVKLIITIWFNRAYTNNTFRDLCKLNNMSKKQVNSKRSGCCMLLSSEQHIIVKFTSFLSLSRTGALKMQDLEMTDLIGLEFGGSENAGLEIDRSNERFLKTEFKVV